jgi:hypothetical protein
VIKPFQRRGLQNESLDSCRSANLGLLIILPIGSILSDKSNCDGRQANLEKKKCQWMKGNTDL